MGTHRIFTRGFDGIRKKDAHFDVEAKDVKEAREKAGRLLQPNEKVTYTGPLPEDEKKSRRRR